MNVQFAPMRKFLPILLIVLLGCGLRLAYWHTKGLRYGGDSGGYMEIAQALAQGEYDPARRPLQQIYPLLLSPSYRFKIPFNSYVVAVHTVLSALSIILAILIGARLFRPSAGLASGLLVAVFPNAIWWFPFVLTETLYLAVLGIFV